MTDEERIRAERLINMVLADAWTKCESDLDMADEHRLRDIGMQCYTAGRVFDAVDAKASEEYCAQLVADLNSERAQSEAFRQTLDDVRSELSSYSPDLRWCIYEICKTMHVAEGK